MPERASFSFCALMTISLVGSATVVVAVVAAVPAGAAASGAPACAAGVSSAAWVKAGQAATRAIVATSTLPVLLFARNMKSLLKTFDRPARRQCRGKRAKK